MPKTAPRPQDLKPLPGDFSALQYATYIDRRKRHREVPMKVLGLGPSRSGTVSMRQALINLGYDDCYHFTAATTENPPDQKIWIEALEAKYEGKGKPFTREDWDQLLGHCQAVTDVPCILFYKELLDAYPEAKVVVTAREDLERWHQSLMNTIVHVTKGVMNPSNSLYDRLLRYYMPSDVGANRLRSLIHANSPMFKAMWYDVDNGTKTAIDWYVNYMEELRELVPKDRLLFMDCAEGWQPLCEFLGEEVPDYQFPRSNDTARFRENFGKVRETMVKAAQREMVKSLGSMALGLAAVGMVVARWIGWLG